VLSADQPVFYSNKPVKAGRSGEGFLERSPP
jgi:hypothetical protein